MNAIICLHISPTPKVGKHSLICVKYLRPAGGDSTLPEYLRPACGDSTMPESLRSAGGDSTMPESELDGTEGEGDLGGVGGDLSLDKRY
jgi:hypothetical protein